LAALSLGKEFLVHTGGEARGLQFQSGHGGKKEKSLPLPGI